jgi:hypothetical protein
MNPTRAIQSHLLATKFFAFIASGTLIRRPCLHTLFSTQAQSLPATQAQVAWLSLDEEDNDPHLFWIYVFSALDQQQKESKLPRHLSKQSRPRRLL